MPTSSEELYVLETFAKFQALKELLEDDIDRRTLQSLSLEMYLLTILHLKTYT